MLVADVSGISKRRYIFPKKEMFDGLHKQLRNDFGIEFPFLVITKKGNVSKKRKL